MEHFLLYYIRNAIKPGKIMLVLKWCIALSLGTVFAADFDDYWNDDEPIESVICAERKGNILFVAANDEEDDCKSVSAFIDAEATTNQPETAAKNADQSIVESEEVPDDFDYWASEGLPEKEPGEENSIESTEFAFDSLTVHDKTYSFEALRRMISVNTNNGNDITALISGFIEKLKVTEFLSMMIDVLDHESFRLFLKGTSDSFPVYLRVDFFDLLNKHILKTNNVDSIKELEKFLEILSQYPLPVNEQRSYYELVITKKEDYCINIRHFIEWELEHIRSQVLKKIDTFFNDKKIDEAINVLDNWSSISWYFILHLAEKSSFSAGRFAFVAEALKHGAIDPEILTESSSGEHVLFTLVSSAKNCNDIIKAFLLHPDCDVSVVNRKGKSLVQVAKSNKNLSAKNREVLIKLLESKSHSKQALDKILQIA